MAGVATKIVVEATGAIATINKVNQSLTRMTTPARGLGIALGRLGDTTGLTRLGGALKSVASVGNTASSALSSVAPALGALTGAATIAGLGRLTTQFAEMTRSTARVAASIGISTTQMRGFTNALGLADVGAEEATAAITNLREIMQGAAWGRNNTAARILGEWGYSISDIRRGSVDLNRVLPDLADRFARMRDPIAAGTLATELFGSAGARMLPVLRQGGAAMRRYLEEGQRNAAVTREQEAAAARLGQSQARLSNSVTHLGTQISTALTPVLAPILDNVSRWIDLNGEWLGQNVAGWVDTATTAFTGFATTLSSFTGGAGTAGDGIAKVTSFVGVLAGVSMVSAMARLTGITGAVRGLSGALMGLARFAIAHPVLATMFGLGVAVNAGLNAGAAEHGNQQDFLNGAQRRMGQRGAAGGYYSGPTVDPDAPPAPPIPSPGPPPGPGASRADREQYAFNFFRHRGMSPTAAAGSVGHLSPESNGLDINSFNRGGGGRGAMGIGQWRAERIARYEERYGRSPVGAPLDQQLDYYMHELGTTERRAAGYINGAPTAGAAAEEAFRRFGRPSPDDRSGPLRMRHAEDILRRYGGSNAPAAPASPPAPGAAPGTAPANPGAAPGPLSSNNRIDLNLRFSGLPPGVSVTASTSSPALLPITRPPGTAPIMPFTG